MRLMDQPPGRTAAEACLKCVKYSWVLQRQNAMRYDFRLMNILVMVCECVKGRCYTDCTAELLAERGHTYGVPRDAELNELEFMVAIKNWVKLTCA